MDQSGQMRVELPELDGLISRIETLEASVTTLQTAGKAPEKQWYSLKESAVYLACSTKTIYRLIERGLLKKSAGLRHIRITRQELDEYTKKTTT